jgi:hypothetical protein
MRSRREQHQRTSRRAGCGPSTRSQKKVASAIQDVGALHARQRRGADRRGRSPLRFSPGLGEWTKTLTLECLGKVSDKIAYALYC